MTTIKVSKNLRERISANAAELHQTVHAFLEKMLDDHERCRRLAQVAAAYSEADAEKIESWRTETREWEAIDSEEPESSRGE
jgi:predicted transcriptional regulator